MKTASTNVWQRPKAEEWTTLSKCFKSTLYIHVDYWNTHEPEDTENFKRNGANASWIDKTEILVNTRFVQTNWCWHFKWQKFHHFAYEKRNTFHRVRFYSGKSSSLSLFYFICFFLRKAIANRSIHWTNTYDLATLISLVWCLSSAIHRVCKVSFAQPCNFIK